MIKVTISQNEQEIASATFPTQEEANTWIAQEVAKNSWGLPERWLRFSNVSEVVSGFVDTRLSDSGTEYKYEAEYEIEQQDITAQVNAQQESDEALRFLQSTDYKVLRHTGQLALGIQTTLTSEEYLELEAERQTARSKVL